jgi:cytochrome P450
LPGIGKGLNAETFVLTDPNEFMKVLRVEGSHPSGGANLNWPLIEYYKKQITKKEEDEMDDNEVVGSPEIGLGLFSTGEQWQKPRRFLQTDLLHPKAAKSYVPGIIKAAQLASNGAPKFANNIKDYTTYCSFDMFSSVMFGEFPAMASGDDRHYNEESDMFCKSVIDGFELIAPMLLSPLEKMQNQMGIETNTFRTFSENFTVARSIAQKKLIRFQERKSSEDGLVNEFEEFSYASRALDRFEEQKTDDETKFTEKDVTEIVIFALSAALDTTSSVINWTLVHLAMNPHVQESLYDELVRNGVDENNELTEEYFNKSKKNTPYLDAIMRENHRITPPLAVNLFKENTNDDVVMHGRTIPKGSMFILDARSMGMDPEYVSAPDIFNPLRWIDNNEGDANSKNHTDERFQHKDNILYKDAFSAGARKCPGSRVADKEAKVLLSQLVLDWKIALDDDDASNNVKSWRDVSYFNGLTIQPDVPKLKFEKR